MIKTINIILCFSLLSFSIYPQNETTEIPRSLTFNIQQDALNEILTAYSTELSLELQKIKLDPFTSNAYGLDINVNDIQFSFTEISPYITLNEGKALMKMNIAGLAIRINEFSVGKEIFGHFVGSSCKQMDFRYGTKENAAFDLEATPLVSDKNLKLNIVPLNDPLAHINPLISPPQYCEGPLVFGSLMQLIIPHILNLCKSKLANLVQETTTQYFAKTEEMVNQWSNLELPVIHRQQQDEGDIFPDIQFNTHIFPHEMNLQKGHLEFILGTFFSKIRRGKQTPPPSMQIENIPPYLFSNLSFNHAVLPNLITFIQNELKTKLYFELTSKLYEGIEDSMSKYLWGQVIPRIGQMTFEEDNLRAFVEIEQLPLFHFQENFSLDVELQKTKLHLYGMKDGQWKKVATLILDALFNLPVQGQNELVVELGDLKQLDLELIWEWDKETVEFKKDILKRIIILMYEEKQENGPLLQMPLQLLVPQGLHQTVIDSFTMKKEESIIKFYTR